MQPRSATLILTAVLASTAALAAQTGNATTNSVPIVEFLLQ